MAECIVPCPKSMLLPYMTITYNVHKTMVLERFASSSNNMNDYKRDAWVYEGWACSCLKEFLRHQVVVAQLSEKCVRLFNARNLCLLTAKKK